MVACLLRLHACSYVCTITAHRVLHQHDKADTLLLLRLGTEKAAEPKVLNPPMVHCLATPPTAECPAAQLVAAACGDGTVAIWDLDKVSCLLLPGPKRVAK